MVVVTVKGTERCRVCGHALFAWDRCNQHGCHGDCCESYEHEVPTREPREPEGE